MHRKTIATSLGIDGMFSYLMTLRNCIGYSASNGRINLNDGFERGCKRSSYILRYCLSIRSRRSSVSIVTRLRAGGPGFNSRQGQWWEFSSSPPHPDRLWGPPSPLSNWHRGLLQHSKAAGAWSWPKLRMRGAIPPLPKYVFMAWCLIKHRDNFTFT
jgi:hypothetical protein